MEYILRHGDSEYKQGKVLLVEADDLTAKGRIDVKRSIAHLSRRLRPKSLVQLVSSKYGRCLSSSKVAQITLSDLGFKVLPINENDNLGEVGNFDWNLFFPLGVGGVVNYAGEQFKIDPKLTNPKRLGPIQFFRTDAAHNLSTKAKKYLPKSFIERVNSFEPYSSVVKRLYTELSKIKPETNRTNILVTHEGLTGELIEVLSNNSQAYLAKGKYFGVEFEKGVWVPVTCQTDSLAFDNKI